MTRPSPSVSVLAIVSLVLSCAATQTVAQGTRDDEEAIKRVVVAMDDAFNAHEPNAALFTRDADFVNVNGTWFKGTAEIENGRRAAFETRLRKASTKSVDVRIRFVRSDVAIVHVISETSGMVASVGHELLPQRVLNLRVLIKVDGSWLVTAFQNTPMPR
jgi:uncharacterized protein (TIGR02246 family)